LTPKVHPGPSPAWIRLRRALVALGALLVAVNLASALWAVASDRARIERDALRDFANLAGLLAAQTAQAFEAVDLLLDAAAGDLGESTGAPAALAARLTDRVAAVPQVRSLLLLGADGRVRLDTSGRIAAGTDLGDRSYFAAARAGSRFVSEPFRSGASGAWEFAVSGRVTDRAGRPIGVLVANVDVAYFSRLYRSLDIGRGGFVALATSGGQVITRVPGLRGQSPGPGSGPAVPFGPIARDGRFAGWVTVPFGNGTRQLLVSAAAIGDRGLDVVVGAPAEAVFAPWRNEAIRIGLQALATSAAILLLIAFGARELGRRAAADERVRRSEEALRSRQQMLDLAQQAAQAAAFEWRLGAGAGGNHWSDGLEPMLGLPPGGYDGTFDTWRGLVHAEDWPAVAAAIERARETGDVSSEYRVLDHDGSVHWLQLKGRLLTDAGGAPVRMVGFMLDVTDRRQAEAERQRQKVLLDELIASAPEAILLCDDAWRVTRVNREFTRIFGYAPAEVLGRDAAALLMPEDRAAEFAEARRRVSHGEHVSLETVRRRKDGSALDASVLAAPIWVAGERIGALVLLRDITERRLAEAEQARLQSRLRQAEKMEAIGRLAGGIAHDFNNLLGGILGYGEMALAEAAAGSPGERYARNILAAAERARDLVDQILAYSRSQRAKRAPVEIDRIVRETVELVRGSLAAGIALDLALPAGPLVVLGDPSQLHQVLMNLCTNAIQAMGDAGTLRVALEPADVATERPLTHGTLAPGPYVRLTVADTGSGMDAATLARIFEPFFTTKEAGRGTGLGLPLVYGIVTDSGGAIDVAAAPGHGSTFAIYLPRTDAQPAAADETQGPAPRGRGERVLLVDDEEPLVDMTAEVLGQLGYEAVPFSDARAALAAFEQSPQAFEVVVTDEVMPALTGTELARRVRHLRPELPVVLLSGYSGPILAQRAHGAGVSELLQKPLHSRALAAALARVLRRAA